MQSTQGFVIQTSFCFLRERFLQHYLGNGLITEGGGRDLETSN